VLGDEAMDSKETGVFIHEEARGQINSYLIGNLSE